MEKPKRKWKSSTCRSGKLYPAPNRSSSISEKETTNQIKNAKRTKIEGTTKGKGVTFVEDVNSKPLLPDNQLVKSELDDVKCEESSDNSFNAFDTIGYELANDIGMYFENIDKVEDGSSISGNECEEKINGVKTEGCKELVPDEKIEDQSGKKLLESLIISDNQIARNHINNKVNGLDCNKNSVDVKKTRRANSFSKAQKNYKKSYVPIQPKPVELPKLVRFEFDPGQFVNKKEEGAGLCEESDSQEPEEEIVRYFQHLDDNQIVGADVFVGQAVKNIENNSVQISVISQDIGNENVNFNEEPLQQLRSQSCFEVYPKSSQAPRSQSSVEFSLGKDERNCRENPDCNSDKKISHLRILLEKSMTCGNENYLSKNEVVMPPVNQIPSNNLQSSDVYPTPIDRNILKLETGKLINRAPLHIAQSPNTRTKYFSFTPISPGPQSPLKTPSTPSASPFVSPRNTPVPRSRQNSSQNDHFIPPTERKLIRNDFSNENVFNFSTNKILPKETQIEYEENVQSYRPRSFSSTNFYRSKARRNLSKVLTYERAIAPAPCQQIDSQIPQYQIPNQNFVSSDSLSNEVQKLFENSKISDGQIATFRSQSVPLNRMMGESSWLSNQISPVYGQFFNFSNQAPVNPTPTPVPSEFSDFVNNTTPDCSKDRGMNSFPDLNQVFPNENQTIDNMTQLNEQLFPNTFPNSNTENFTQNFTPDLNSFANDADSVITENFLPSFENSDDKGNPEEVQPDDGKLFKNALYDGNNENVKDPVITSFKPTLMGEFTSSPNSPVLNFFGTKNE